MRILAAISALLIWALSPVAFTSTAAVHATLLSSEPADGAVIAAAPARLVLAFNEPVSPLVLRLVSPNGATTLLQGSVEGASSLAIALPAGLLPGTHVASWRVVSLDGHPIGGAVVFSIGAPSSNPGLATTSAAGTAVSVALWTLKFAFYVGLVIGVGGSSFLAWMAPGVQDAGRSAISIALIAALIATPVLVGVQGVDALDLPLSGLASSVSWKTGLETSFGATAIAAACALFTAFFALQARTTYLPRALSLLGVTIAGLALALSGHASAATPQWLTRPAVIVHTISVAFWIGALLPLGATMLGHVQPEAILVRFSRAIPWAVAALVGSGAALAFIQLEEPRDLLTTAYGLVLSAKLTLVVLVLALATWNRFSLTPAVIGGSPDPRRKLARLISIEVAIAFVVLGVVGLWRFTPPPRALASASAQPALVHMHTAAAMADVTFEPGRAGMTRVGIAVMTGGFVGLEAKEVRLTLQNRAAAIEAISRPATKTGDATWIIEMFPIPTGGRWNAKIDILINDFEKVTLEDQINIRDR